MKSWSSWPHAGWLTPTRGQIHVRSEWLTDAVAAARRGQPVSGDAHESRRKRTDGAAN